MCRRLLTFVVCLLVSTCGPTTPPIEIEPEPEEDVVPEFECEGQLERGMLPISVELRCGKPTSKIYSPALPEAIAWRYCVSGSSCRRMAIVLFLYGEAFKWGRAYEVPTEVPTE